MIIISTVYIYTWYCAVVLEERVHTTQAEIGVISVEDSNCALPQTTWAGAHLVPVGASSGFTLFFWLFRMKFDPSSLYWAGRQAIMSELCRIESELLEQFRRLHFEGQRQQSVELSLARVGDKIRLWGVNRTYKKRTRYDLNVIYISMKWSVNQTRENSWILWLSRYMK